MVLLGQKRTHNFQAGFMLIEVLLATAITGLIAAGIMATISQVFIVNASSGSRMSAIKQVESAIDRMRADVQMAQTVRPDPDSGTGFPLDLAWKGWDNTSVEITYHLVGDELRRQISTNGNLPVDSTVARDVQSIQINSISSEDAARKINLTITAFVSGYRSAAESRTFEILCRPGT